MSAICEGIALSRTDKARAMEFVAKTGRNMDAAGIEYLYRLYIADVIPTQPYLKPEGIALAIQMTASLMPSGRPMTAQELSDSSLIPDLEKEGRCKYETLPPLHLQVIDHTFDTADAAGDLFGASTIGSRFDDA